MNPNAGEDSQQNRVVTAQLNMVLHLMDRWQLTAMQRTSILALRDASGDQQALFSQLLHIHKILRLLFPANRQLAYRWMTSANRAFDGLMPIELIQRDGHLGLQATQSYLARYAASDVTEPGTSPAHPHSDE